MAGGCRIRCLVVEDEAMLAMDLEMMLEERGHQVVGQAACAASASALAADIDPQLALVDLQLAHGTSGLDVMTMIRQRWPDALVVFVTANPARIPQTLEGSYGVIAKPFSRRGLLSALAYLEEGICDPPPAVACPVSFAASPALAARWAA